MSKTVVLDTIEMLCMRIPIEDQGPTGVSTGTIVLSPGSSQTTYETVRAYDQNADLIQQNIVSVPPQLPGPRNRKERREAEAKDRRKR